VNLQPQELYWFSKSDDFEKARDYNLFDCIECGCCSYVCPSDIPLVQYYRYAKSEIIAADKAKEAADLARERNEFRLARIEREKLERAQKHAERALSGKTEPKTEEILVDKSAVAPNANADATQNTANKQAAIAAAIARAKAQKSASAEATSESLIKEIVVPEVTKTADIEAAELKAKQDKQVLIAAAIERAKAQKLAASQAGLTPKNIENVSASIQAEINDTDAIREKAKLSINNKNSD
jgi:electron transport complex protein RnfC